MEKITRKPLSKIPSLSKLKKGWRKWGIEIIENRRSWQSSGNLYKTIKKELGELTIWHCSFCDGFPLDETSPATIEHYCPKEQYKFQTYHWKNLFYCCSKCQSNANKIKHFQPTLKPDSSSYHFDNYFYFDPYSGRLEILETLEETDLAKFNNANNFLIRYGINDNPKRLEARKSKFKDIKNFFKIADPNDNRTRDDFAFRYVYDLAKFIYESTTS
jgi:uncharacterized protein (TIGR02646 family)